MKHKLISIAAIFGAMAVVLGALGAHQLKTVLSADSLDSFDKGVRYQMYHSLLLFILSLNCKAENEKEIKRIAFLLIIGIIFFSFSIYLLTTQGISNLNFSFLGPITPVGGLLFITSWILIALRSKRIFNN